MKIAIEAQRIFRTNKHGMDFVALETIRCIQKLDTQNEYFIIVSPGEDICLESSANMHIVEVSAIAYPLWEQVALPRALNKINPDVVHCTSNTAPLWCNYPLVLTLHDIIFLEKRGSKSSSFYQNLGRIYRRLVVPRILGNCARIITVSNFERDRIKKALGLAEDKIIAVYNGYSSHFKQLESYHDVVVNYLFEPNYIFFLGNTDPKKNTPLTLKGYALYLDQSKRKLPLLVADLKQSVVDKILQEQNIEHIRPYIRCAGYISNTDLPYIYNGASAFLYTSLRESFGIPLLEAMACGTPVVASNTSAIPEIAGSGSILIDPLAPEQIAAQLISLETDPLFTTKQIAYGLNRVKLFSWEQTARKMMEIYRSL